MTFEKELLSNLDDFIKNGDIVVDSASDNYFAQLGVLFPTLGSKINWKEVPESIEQVASKEDYIEACFNFFRKVCKENGLSGKIILIGDSAMESTLIMPIHVLNSHLKKVLEIPQHHYLIAEDYSWCMSFTMEGDMAFGFKPPDR